jgi:hypothetical protein
MASNGVKKVVYGEYTASNLEREPYWPQEKLRISITGAGGFIASHIARRLKTEGHYIVASDWKKNEHMSEDMFCDEFHLVDLRVMDNCLAVTKGVQHVFNLAADMGGMGFIQSNHSVIMYNNTMISFNMLEAARINGIHRYVCVCVFVCVCFVRVRGRSLKWKNQSSHGRRDSQWCFFSELFFAEIFFMFQFRIPAFLSWCLLLLIMGRAFFVQSVFLSCCSCDWQNNWCRFFYASSACIYPEFKQLETNVSLKESDAWPAEVTITYNLVFFCKKLFSIPLRGPCSAPMV